MILLTVGTQLPFDRLVRLMDALAPALSAPVIAQIGAGKYRPINMECRTFIDPIELEAMLASCTLIVSHAGIGAVVMAQRHLKPLILFPRLASLVEHRNDHQVATVRALEGRDGLYVANTDEDLARLVHAQLSPPALTTENAERDLLRSAVEGFIGAERARRAQRRKR